jgi:hopanoid biosynthesis associated RND transporter like protein HpnN
MEYRSAPASLISSLIGRVVEACCERAWSVLLLSLVVAGLAFSYVSQHIAIDTDSEKLFPPDLPWRQRQAVLDRAFPQRNGLIAVVIDGATPELAQKAADDLSRRLATIHGPFRSVTQPDGGPFFAHNGLLFLSTAEVERTARELIAAQPLLGSLAADPSLRGVMDTIDRLMQGVRHGATKLADVDRALRALADSLQAALAGKLQSLSWQTLISGHPPSPRALRRFILVQPVLQFDALEPGKLASDAIRQAARDLGLTPENGVRVRLTGPVPLADEEFATLADGALGNAVLTIAAVALLLWLGLRSGRIIVSILSMLAIGLVLTAAFGLMVVGPFNLISMAFAVLFVGLGVDLGIQFSVRCRAERYRRDDLQEALVAAGRGVGGSLALAATSIAAGFYAFLPTAYRGVSQLGLIAGTGMVIAFLLSITLLPALLMLLRPPGERAEVGYAFLVPLDHLLLRRRRAVLLGAGALAAVCLALMTQLTFDFNPLDLRNPKTESVATLLDLMKNPETSPNTVEVLAPSLDAARQLADRLARLPEVAQAVTLASYIPEDPPAKLALIHDAAQLLDLTLNPLAVKPPPSDAEVVAALGKAAALLRAAANAATDAAAGDARRLADVLSALAAADPAKRKAAEAALVPSLHVMLGQLRDSLQAGPVDLKTLPRELVEDWLAPDGKARIQVFPKGNANDNAVLSRFIAAVRAVAPDATGAPISIQESSRTVVDAFAQAGLLALAAISLLLAAVLRRIGDVLRTLAPLFLSGLLTLGICVAVGLPLNFANIIALPLLFGIGVAFNIYFVMAWRRGESHPLQSSLTRGILFSGLTTGAAFGSLCLSNHPGTASMGYLLALSLACTLASALLFLPALLGPPRPALANADGSNARSCRGGGRNVKAA